MHIKESNNTYKAFENNYNLNIAFPVSDRIITWDSTLYANPVDSQQDLFADATGIDGIYTKIYDYDINCNNVRDVTEDDKFMGNFSLNKIDNDADASATAVITAQTNGHIYLYLYSRNLDDVSIYSPSINTSMGVKDGYILDLGYYNAYDKISVTMPISDDNSYANVDFVAFTIDTKKFIDGYNILKNGQLEYTNFTDTLIEGTFTAEEDEMLFTSIPYDKGWNVYIDGEKVSEDNIVRVSEALLGVKVTSGEHTLKLEYAIPGLNIAYIISGLFVILLITAFILKKKNLFIFKNMKSDIWEDSNQPIESNTLNNDFEIIVEEEIPITEDNNTEE